MPDPLDAAAPAPTGTEPTSDRCDAPNEPSGARRFVFRPSPGDAAGRRRWRAAALIGALLAAPVQLWMLTAGTWDLTRWERIGDFYDAQARALRHGALAMDHWVLGIEAFYRDGNTYMYFGPVPAVLRLPVVALTDRFDGRMTTISFLAALTVLFAVVRSIGWRVRVVVSGVRPVGRAEQVMVAAMMFGVLAGSAVLYLSSRTWVYHEASIWGLTFTLGAFAALLAWLDTGRLRFVVGAGAWTTLAVCTRVSVAGAALTAQALCLAGVLVASALRRTGGDRRSGRVLERFAWVPAGAVSAGAAKLLAALTAAPLAAYATINYIKFRTLFSVPFEDQASTRLDPARQQMLEDAGGSLFNVRYLPTNLVQYWRPDMIGVSTRWPWITFPQRPPLILGAPPYDLIDLTAGIPIAMPALCAFGGVGAWRAFRRHDRPAHLRIFVLAGLAGTLSVLTIGYLANRYHADFVPLLVVTALIGLATVTGWAAQRSRRTRTLVVAATLALVVVSTVVNLALGHTFQRAYGPGASPAQLAGYISTQMSVADRLGDGPTVRHGDRLPPAGEFGDVFVLGDCDAVYWSDGMRTDAAKRSNWNVVETATGVSGFAARIVIDPPERGMVQPLFSLDGDAGPTTVYLVLGPGSSVVQIGYAGPDGGVLGSPIPTRFGRPLALDVIADHRVTMLEVRLDGRVGLTGSFAGDAEPVYGVDAIGLDFIDAPFGGTVDPAATTMPLCDRLRRSR